jgi:hypothetical protein
MKEANIYQQILEITDDYLGPASKRFVDRQVISHLQKPPEKLTPEDLPVFADWASAVIALLTEDKAVVAEYEHRIKALGQDYRTG